MASLTQTYSTQIEVTLCDMTLLSIESNLYRGCGSYGCGGGGCGSCGRKKKKREALEKMIDTYQNAKEDDSNEE